MNNNTPTTPPVLDILEYLIPDECGFVYDFGWYFFSDIRHNISDWNHKYEKGKESFSDFVIRVFNWYNNPDNHSVIPVDTLKDFKQKLTAYSAHKKIELSNGNGAIALLSNEEREAHRALKDKFKTKVKEDAKKSPPPEVNFDITKSKPLIEVPGDSPSHSLLERYGVAKYKEDLDPTKKALEIGTALDGRKVYVELKKDVETDTTTPQEMTGLLADEESRITYERDSKGKIIGHVIHTPGEEFSPEAESKKIADTLLKGNPNKEPSRVFVLNKDGSRSDICIDLTKNRIYEFKGTDRDNWEHWKEITPQYQYTKPRYEFPGFNNGAIQPDHITTEQRIEYLLNAVFEDFDFEERMELTYALIAEMIEDQDKEIKSNAELVSTGEERLNQLYNMLRTIGASGPRPRPHKSE